MKKSIGIAFCIVWVAAGLATPGQCAGDANSIDLSNTAKPTPLIPWKGSGTPSDKLPKQTDLFRQFATAIGFVAILGAGAFYVSRRLGPRWSPSRGRHLRIVESIGLGPHRQIHLLEVDGRRLVVGSTAQSIGLIAEIPEAAESKGSDPQ